MLMFLFVWHEFIRQSQIQQTAFQKQGSVLPAYHTRGFIEDRPKSKKWVEVLRTVFMILGLSLLIYSIYYSFSFGI